MITLDKIMWAPLYVISNNYHTLVLLYIIYMFDTTIKVKRRLRVYYFNILKRGQSPEVQAASEEQIMELNMTLKRAFR